MTQPVRSYGVSKSQHAVRAKTNPAPGVFVPDCSQRTCFHTPISELPRTEIYRSLRYGYIRHLSAFSSSPSSEINLFSKMKPERAQPSPMAAEPYFSVCPTPRPLREQKGSYKFRSKGFMPLAVRWPSWTDCRSPGLSWAGFGMLVGWREKNEA